MPPKTLSRSWRRPLCKRAFASLHFHRCSDLRSHDRRNENVEFANDGSAAGRAQHAERRGGQEGPAEEQETTE